MKNLKHTFSAASNEAKFIFLAGGPEGGNESANEDVDGKKEATARMTKEATEMDDATLASEIKDAENTIALGVRPLIDKYEGQGSSTEEAKERAYAKLKTANLKADVYLTVQTDREAKNIASM